MRWKSFAPMSISSMPSEGRCGHATTRSLSPTRSSSAIAISQTERWADLALIGAGLLISCVWLFVTVEGWAVVRRHVEIAGKLQSHCFRNLLNPFSAPVYGRSQATIYRLMLVVIVVFMLMYLGLGVLRLA